MVPIHTKRSALKDERKAFYISLLLKCRESFLLQKKQDFLIVLKGDCFDQSSGCFKSLQVETWRCQCCPKRLFSIKKGEIFGIIGYSGAGKFLIRLLNLEKTSGTVEVAGTKINEVNGRGLRKARHEISMIFQHFNLLWSRTVRDNIMFPLEIAGVKKSERIKRANELIKLVGLEGKEKSYPSS